MTYYFPGPFISNEYPDTSGITLGLTVNSGKNALRLALRSFQLPAQSLVGIPAFSCNEVVNAVLEENLKPYFFDSYQGSYWGNYEESIIKSKGIKAIIITHLYGYVHPSTKEIADVCKRNGVKIVHDAAQSFGINASVFGNDPVVYSFGPGKSATAAGGGELLNVKSHGATIGKSSLADKLAAKAFFKSRLFGFKNKSLNGRKLRLFKRFGSDAGAFTDLSSFQEKKAKEAKAIALLKNNGRRERYLLLKDAVLKNDEIKIVYEEQDGLYFKLLLYVPGNTEHFLDYLKNNHVPYCRLADSMDMSKRDTSHAVLFNGSYKRIVEISSERSIPVEEIKRVAAVLAAYRNGN